MRFDNLRAESNALRIRYETKLQGIADLKQSILQRAFSGELTSPAMHIIQQAAE
jgi:hypothetical protein